MIKILWNETDKKWVVVVHNEEHVIKHLAIFSSLNEANDFRREQESMVCMYD